MRWPALFLLATISVHLWAADDAAKASRVFTNNYFQLTLELPLGWKTIAAQTGRPDPKLGNQLLRTQGSPNNSMTSRVVGDSAVPPRATFLDILAIAVAGQGRAAEAALQDYERTVSSWGGVPMGGEKRWRAGGAELALRTFASPADINRSRYSGIATAQWMDHTIVIQIESAREDQFQAALQSLRTLCFGSPSACREHGSTHSREPIRLARDEAQKLLLHKVAPIYPAEAEEAGVDGVVLLRVRVGTGGSVKDVEVVSGPAELVQSSITAVRQWNYKPHVVNGKAVEFETEVAVNYTYEPRQ